MAHLTRAHNELYRRSPDEQYPTLEALMRHCEGQKRWSEEKWNPPSGIRPEVAGDALNLRLGEDGEEALKALRRNGKPPTPSGATNCLWSPK